MLADFSASTACPSDRGSTKKSVRNIGRMAVTGESEAMRDEI